MVSVINYGSISCHSTLPTKGERPCQAMTLIAKSPSSSNQGAGFLRHLAWGRWLMAYFFAFSGA